MNKKTENKAVSPWQWVPSLYFAQGIPYVVVMSVAVILFKRMGMSNTDIALYTSGLNLPWVIKPLWSPLVDLLKTKRWWIVVMQILVGAGLAGIALTIQGPLAFRYCLAFMWLLAFSSATHDIAADGFYMLGLNEKKQAYFVGIRNTFYRFAVIFGQGILVMFAGWLEQRYAREMPETAAIPQAWSLTFYLLTILFALLFVYHYLFLPHPRRDTCTLPPQQASAGRVFKEFLGTFTSFLPKETHRQCPDLHPALSVRRSAVGENHFSLSAGYSGYRRTCPIYGRSRLYLWYDRRHRPDDRRNCRRNRYGTAGIEVLPMDHDHCHEPAQYRVSVSLLRPTGKYRNHIGCVAIEQFGYGFGFTSLTYFMMLFSNGKHQTAHYAICTGFMALGLMLPGMISGWIEESIGYRAFFVWIMLCTIPSFWATHLVRKNLTDNHSDNSSR